MSGEHLLGVVNTLLDVSRIESGAFPLDPEPLSVADLVEGTAEILRINADQSRVTLVCVVEPGLPRMLADQRACRQMLLNLVGNAIKFTPSGGEVRLKAARDGECIAFSVQDTGIGIAPEDQSRLCEPFFKTRLSRDAGVEGTGLGLSVVKSLVSLHGGTMRIESTPGHGTMVRLVLPLTPPDRRRNAPIHLPSRMQATLRAETRAAAGHHAEQSPTSRAVKKSA